MPAPLLEASRISKRFGATQALSGVDLALHAGEIHALLGENGAGKSTLLKILGGVEQADAGRLQLAGSDYAPAAPREALRSGVVLVHQELALCAELSVEQNLCLGREPRRGLRLDLGAQRERARTALALVGMSDLDPARSIGTLSIAQRQWLEIARALVHPSRVLVLDEPTSSLAREDVTRLFRLVRAASQQGTAVLYVSHALEEVRELCTHWTVLRDGESVASGEVRDTPTSRLIAHMAGRELGELYPRRPHTPAEELLRVSVAPPADPLIVRRGEVLGIYGLIGAGRSELLRGIFGLDPQTAELEVLHARGARTPAERWAMGVGMVVEDRAREGLFLERSLADNLSLPALRGLFSSPAARRATSEPWRERLAIKSASVEAPMRTLSGGNQQKVALARLLAAKSQLFLLDEPTRGVDVRAKSEIYRWIDTIASEQRGGVLLVSSYAPELLGVCDTIRVMQAGVLGPARPASEWTQEQLVEAAFGAERAA